MSEMTKKLRVGLVGSGFGLKVHLPGLLALSEQIEFVGVATSSPEKAAAITAQHGVPAFASYGDLLAAGVDLLDITTPPFLHRETVLAAVAAGAHVLCEKPFALNVAEAREMQSAAAAHGLTTAINHEFRFLPARHYMKQLLDDGYLGTVYAVQQSEMGGWLHDPAKRPWDWWMDETQGGGLLGAIGSHYLDTIRWFFGEVDEVCATVDTYTASRPLRDQPNEQRKVTSDDAVAILGRLANGAELTMHLSGMSLAGRRQIEAFGSDGSLSLDTSRDEAIYGVEPGQAEKLRLLRIPNDLKLAQVGEHHLQAPFMELIRRLAAAIRAGEAAAVDVASFADGVAVQQLLDAVRLSSKERRWVKVNSLLLEESNGLRLRSDTRSSWSRGSAGRPAGDPQPPPASERLRAGGRGRPQPLPPRPQSGAGHPQPLPGSTNRWLADYCRRRRLPPG